MTGIPLAAVIGVSGTVVTEAEAGLIRERPPLGVILFRRNVTSPDQLGALVRSLRAMLPPGGLLMVDQEGGRVARLRPPGWLAHPPAAAIGELFGRDAQAGLRVAWLTGALIGTDCAGAGFDVVCAPVLDRSVPGAHDVIGDRAFASDPSAIASLSGAFADGLLAAGVQPVGKHVPGHGRAGSDSHLELPELDDIDEADLAVFAALIRLPWMMTAHIRYRAVDPLHPATLSRSVLQEVVRDRLGFDNLLISDDLAMQALRGSAGQRALQALQAGCDVALHCSGLIEESRDVLGCVPVLDPVALERLDRARALGRARRVPLDAASFGRERERLLC